jgi:glycosyltransferase involved in cell wall biosynthesis
LTSPLVTVGLTTFNSAETVERALRSALAQTWRPIEVVAVDDCSTDGTRELLDRLATQHPELRVFGNAVNSGVAVSRNRILAEARGEFVAFFDDDDESLPERIASQFARITAYEREFADGAPVICHTARRLIYARRKERIAPTMGQREGRRAPAGPAVARRILLGTHLEDGYGACPTSSQMARLSTYRALGGFDPELRRSEDTDFNIRLAAAGGHFVGIGRPLVIQTMTRTSEKSLAEEYRYMLRDAAWRWRCPTSG